MQSVGFVCTFHKERERKRKNHPWCETVKGKCLQFLFWWLSHSSHTLSPSFSLAPSPWLSPSLSLTLSLSLAWGESWHTHNRSPHCTPSSWACEQTWPSPEATHQGEPRNRTSSHPSLSPLFYISFYLFSFPSCPTERELVPAWSFQLCMIKLPVYSPLLYSDVYHGWPSCEVHVVLHCWSTGATVYFHALVREWCSNQSWSWIERISGLHTWTRCLIFVFFLCKQTPTRLRRTHACWPGACACAGLSLCPTLHTRHRPAQIFGAWAVLWCPESMGERPAGDQATSLVCCS